MVHFIQGTNIPFTVKSYKEDLGVSYHAIFYIFFHMRISMTLMRNILTCLQVFCKYTSTFLLDKDVQDISGSRLIIRIFLPQLFGVRGKKQHLDFTKLLTFYKHWNPVLFLVNSTMTNNNYFALHHKINVI